MKRASSGGCRLLAWVLWLQAWQVAAPCPGACVCYNEPKVTTSCPQQGLQAVPVDIPAASQRVFLHGNLIAHVPAAGFRACRNLTILWLHSNALARIDKAAFAGLTLLEQLDLSDNAQLRTVDPATFQGLGRLHTLHLDRCGLQELGPGLFHGLAALQYLYLQDNGLQALPDDAFRDLGNLTHLFLHGNRIPSVPERAFRGLHSLDRLLLHQNRVARVHPHAFRDLGRLMTLYLFANNLSALPAEALTPLRALQYLRLNDNPGCVTAVLARSGPGCSSFVAPHPRSRVVCPLAWLAVTSSAWLLPTWRAAPWPLGPPIPSGWVGLLTRGCPSAASQTLPTRPQCWRAGAQPLPATR